MAVINEDICRKCGGKCCKKCGCDYFVSDFDTINKEYLCHVLDTGNVSIVAALNFIPLPGGKVGCEPFLYLRARNVDREVVDLFSLKKQCSMLQSNGCFYTPEERPSGGLALIPKEDGHCELESDRAEELKSWLPYQQLLARLVKRYSGMSLDERFKSDIFNTFCDIFTKNFDGVADDEIRDAISSISELSQVFPDIYKRALDACKVPYKSYKLK